MVWVHMEKASGDKNKEGGMDQMEDSSIVKVRRRSMKNTDQTINKDLNLNDFLLRHDS